MIHANRIVTVGEQESIIDRPIVLYRGDREVEIEFTLVGNEFTFSEEGNVIKSVNASHGQLVLNTPSGEHMFSELAECREGKVVFVVTKEMIDEFIEMGFYSFQIRLYDSAEMKSRVTIPPVMNGFDIRNPIAAEDETNVVDQGIVDYARIFKDQSNEELPTFDWTGAYNKTEWVHHDVITENKMNKIEDALYSINANVKESDVVMLNALDKVKKDADAYVKEHMAEVEADVDEFERNLNTDVQKFKVDANAAMTAHKNEVSEVVDGFDAQLTVFENDINRRSINVANLFTEELTDDNTAKQFWDAFMYCLDNGYMAFVPRGTYIVKRWNPPSSVEGISDSYCLIIPNGLDVIFEQGVKFKLINDAPQWSRVVAPLGNNNLYGHFEIDGSADTVTNGNEHMAGLFVYGKENIYIESLYSYNCYGDNVQLTGSESQGKNIIIDRLRCRKAGRKNLVFENTTNIHIKNAYLDNTEGGAGVWTGGGCLDIEPLSANNDCYYKIDRLETTGTNDFTIGTKLEHTPKFVLDIGTLVQHSGQLFSYALTINIGTAIFYNCAIYQMYSSHINIDNAIFRNQSKRMIDSYHSRGAYPVLSIKNLNVFGDSTIEEHELHLIFSQGANIYIGNAWIDGYNNTFIGTNTTQDSTVSFDNLYLNNVGKPGSYMSYLSSYGNGKLYFNVGNVIVKDNRETLPTCLFNVVTHGANDGMNVRNILNDTGIQTSRSNYGNFIPVLTNGGTTDRRPTKPGHAEQYYDTTLKKPIWWNGSKWTDATGAEV